MNVDHLSTLPVAQTFIIYAQSQKSITNRKIRGSGGGLLRVQLATDKTPDGSEGDLRAKIQTRDHLT
jgi:hypothetical protein